MNNMYDWIDNTRNFIGGECPHKCSYCYVKSMPYKAVRERYSGKIRLFEDEFKKPLKSKSGKPIFIGSCFDMFADAVPEEMILRVFRHCERFDITYVFQSKNARRFNDYNILHHFPVNSIIGTTIETDNWVLLKTISDNSEPFARAHHLSMFRDHERFITIEPILEFKLENLVAIIQHAEPTWVNIGADSKNHGLPEPSWEKVEALIAELKKFTVVKCKFNLERLKKPQK